MHMQRFLQLLLITNHQHQHHNTPQLCGNSSTVTVISEVRLCLTVTRYHYYIFSCTSQLSRPFSLWQNAIVAICSHSCHWHRNPKLTCITIFQIIAKTTHYMATNTDHSYILSKAQCLLETVLQQLTVTSVINLNRFKVTKKPTN